MSAQHPGATTWGPSTREVVVVAASLLFLSAVLGVGVGLITLKLDSTAVRGDSPLALILAVACTGLALLAVGLFVGRRGFTRVIVTPDTVEVRRAGKRLHLFDRDATTFHSSVHRRFMSGARSTGGTRALVATPVGIAPDDLSQIVKDQSGFLSRQEPASAPAVTPTLVMLPFFSRREFALLLDAIRTPRTLVNVDETRFHLHSRFITSTQFQFDDDAGVSLPQTKRKGRAAMGVMLPIERHSILRRALLWLAGTIVVAPLVAQVARVPVFDAARLIGAIGLFMLILAVPATLFFLFRVVWLAARVPHTVQIDHTELRIGRHRYPLAELAEISLHPPSYPVHARTLTVRPRRGRARSWLLGYDLPGGLADRAFPQYEAFARAVVAAATASGVTLIWDLD